MSENLNLGIELQDVELVPPGTPLRLANCECPYTTGEVPYNSATSCRIIDIPFRITNLCPNKEYLLFVTVTDEAGAKIGQICSIFTKGESTPCTTPSVHRVRLVIKKPVCSTDTIYVTAIGNYTSICDI